MKNQKNFWVWVGVLVALLLVAVAVFWPRIKTVVLGQVPVYAPQGQLVAGFPPQLVLDSSAQVSNSYAINYSSSTNQYTATWTSTSSVTDIFNQYKTYFAANGWTTPASGMEATKNGDGIYATGPTANASVAIVPQGQNSQVTLTYLLK